MSLAGFGDGAKIRKLRAQAITIPTDSPESDGTLEWDSTTIVVAEVEAGGKWGIGYTYSHPAAASLINTRIKEAVVERDAFNVEGAWRAMVATVRNFGRQGVAACAISAADVALWDLKAKLLREPLARLLGQVRTAVPVYGSGGFTSYSINRLQAQLAGWARTGITRVKMKVGRDPGADANRVRAARQAIGPRNELMVDANGAYEAAQALRMSAEFAEQGVGWFEEPVNHEDLPGLQRVREHAPKGMEIAAGEYGYDATYFHRMLAHSAVDVLQADATRCGGVTGFLQAAALCDAYRIPLSSHTAPAVHTTLGCARNAVRHLEYFHDHVRVEAMVFDGVAEVRGGMLAPQQERPGLGLELKRSTAARYAA